MNTKPSLKTCSECDNWDNKENECWIGYKDYDTCPIAHEFDEDVV